jgi:hypothetical protein
MNPVKSPRFPSGVPAQPPKMSRPRSALRALANLTAFARGGRVAPAPRWWRWAPWLLVAGACTFCLVVLAGELATVQPVNDESVHFEMVRWAVQQINEGHVPLLAGGGFVDGKLHREHPSTNVEGTAA